LHWATRNPERVIGVVMVDGGYPWDDLATVQGGREAGKQEIRKLSGGCARRCRWPG
jgi:hypothetical protein